MRKTLLFNPIIMRIKFVESIIGSMVLVFIFFYLEYLLFSWILLFVHFIIIVIIIFLMYKITKNGSCKKKVHFKNNIISNIISAVDYNRGIMIILFRFYFLFVIKSQKWTNFIFRKNKKKMLNIDVIKDQLCYQNKWIKITVSQFLEWK